MLLVYIYLILGLLYAIYIFLYGEDAWYLFPINVLFGPFAAVFVIYKTFKGQRIGPIK